MAKLELNDDNFVKAVLNAPGVVLVDFFAVWCGPCQAMKSVIAEIAAEELEGVTVGEVDIDQASELASKYVITSVPTFKIFKAGEVIDGWTGVETKAQLKKRLNKALGN